MFVPLDRKLDWQNPPYITLVLIVVNLLIFSLLQTSDDSKFTDAYNYYYDSLLPEIELPEYVQYLNKHSNQQKAKIIKNIIHNKNSNNHQLRLIIIDMLADGGYKKALELGLIILPNNKNYESWKRQRSYFKGMLDDITGYKYALIASEPAFLDFFTYQFLHADWGHLIGNMIFLFMFGFVLESALSRPIYIAAYLLAGIGSGIFYIILDSNSAVASIGASGSISGLVGMYTIVFGFRKIRFFYYLLVYFNYVKAPAIILLPLWLLYDLSLQLWGPTNVNNIAHIGGLISGAAIAYAIKKFTQTIDIKYVDQEDDKLNYENDYHQALELVSKLEFTQASTIFQKLYKLNPNDSNVHFQLYNIEKHNPNSKLFHIHARNLLSNTNSDKESIQRLHAIYTEYTKLGNSSQLSTSVLFHLITKFAAPFTVEAESIMLLLLNTAPEFEKIPNGLALLIKTYQLQHNKDKIVTYFEILKNNYPNSIEAKKMVI